jgi:hypothetical protein
MTHIDQRLIIVEGADYSNFFFTPGSIDSLKSFLDLGYTVKFIKDTGYKASILLERVYES